ncbi:MAG: GNAT family N-acetyltransferase [Actinobacteria bacterium]|nr:GNAT family N-acetyltransferase [Actinomycetota bacterium]
MGVTTGTVANNSDRNHLNPVRLEKGLVKDAVNSLCGAFGDYPLVKQFFPQRERRERFIRYFVSVPLYYGMKYGEVYATSRKVEGIAVWIPSQKHPMSSARVARAVPFNVLVGFGFSGASGMRGVDRFINEVHERLVPYDHWFLQMIGVDPCCQGKGYSSILLKPMLSRIDEERLPCYLETNTEENVEIYRHFGFEVLEESIIPGTDVKNWAMLRG